MQSSRGRFGHYRDQDGPSRGGLGFYSRGGGRGGGEGGAGRGRGRGNEEGGLSNRGGRGGARGRGSGFRPRGRGLGRFNSSDKQFKKSYSDEVREYVDEIYGKKFKFSDEFNKWRLPSASAMFHGALTNSPPLRELKEKLNSTKSKLDNKELTSWHKHTNFTNRTSGLVPMLRREVQPEMCTQAWLKMHEILWTFNIVPQAARKFNSVHLCEAPGAFIASLNHFIKTHRIDCEWHWKAMTLNPYHEANSPIAMIDQDNFMSKTLKHWYLGPDNTGDVMVWENLMGLREEVRGEMEEVNLVTADGSINCWGNPGEQEAMVAQLVFCEVVAGLTLLKAGGSLIVKTFTTLEHPTVCLMYLLACTFRELHIFKPASSKAGNSEQYAVCIGYKSSEGLTQKHMEILRKAYGVKAPGLAMFSLDSIPDSFTRQLQNCATKFAKYQIDTIEENLRLYDCMRCSEKQAILESKDLICELFISRFKIKKLARDKATVTHIFLNGSHLSIAQPVQDESLAQMQEHRTVDSFISKMERTRAFRSGVRGRGGLGGGGEGEGDEEEEDLHSTGAKRAKISTLSEECREAVEYLLSTLGYEGGRTDLERTQLDQPLVAMAMEPDDIQWMKGPTNKQLGLHDLKTLEGLRVNKVINSRFCRPESLKKLTEALENSQVMQPSHADEHDHIASCLTASHALLTTQPQYFLSAEALNFAAVDHLTDFTEKEDDSQLMTFVDLAGAPSGYSHYVYWRKQNLAKGWGMVRVEKPKLGVSPNNAIDKLAPWDSFQVLGPHSGVDILDNNSIKSLCAGVLNYCQTGVQLVIGDVPSCGSQQPGFAEYHVKQHFIAQCVCALKILKPGGAFVCRIYELLTRFSAGLVYIMYRLFEEVTVVKPLSSSPTSPERFLVCKKYQGSKPDMLLALNNRLAELREKEGGKKDVLEILPIQLLFEEPFYHLLSLSNDRIARYRTRTITHLEKHYLQPDLPHSESQALLRKGLLFILNLPESPSLPYSVL